LRSDALVLVAASLLRVPSRRLRALALGDEGALRDWLANESATRLAEARRDARLAAAHMLAAGARVVSIADPDYPGGLKALRDAPPFLIARGETPRTPWPEGVAIVGSRDAEPEAAAFARALAGRVGLTVVSGLALGIDAAAHEGALAAGTRTVAYVANGIGATYPPEHRDLEERIVAGGGTVASERLPGEPAMPWALVKRDRLQAAHAAAVVLIQSRLDGGAMHTLRFARELGRPVFALAPRDGEAYAGNVRALGAGARELPWNPDEAASLLR
jgi:DNA protecting protein DprA